MFLTAEFGELVITPLYLSEAQIKGIKRRRGIIKIGYFQRAVGGENIESIVDAIHYTVGLIVIENVSLVSDFDGAVSAPIDASRLNELTRALSDKGYMGEEIALIMDGNVLRLLLDFCPIKMYSEGS